MSNENTKNEKRTDSDRYRDLAKLSQSSWWESDTVNQTFTFSDYIVDLVGANKNTFSYEEVLALVREDYRQLMAFEVVNKTFEEQNVYNRKFPIVTPRGDVWIRCTLGYPYKDGARVGIFGMLQIVPEEEPRREVSAVERTSKILLDVEKVAKALSNFLTDKQEADIVDDILGSMLTYYDATDVHLTEFTENGTFHQCTYQVDADGYAKPSEKYKCVKCDDIRWWTDMIKSNRAIILDDISQLPPEAESEYKLFDSIDHRAMMIVPLTNDGIVWGYVGVYHVGSPRHWNTEDYLWMFSMANILGVCIELSRQQKSNEEGRIYWDNLIKKMPIGYTRIKAIRNLSGEITDYCLAEVNNTSSRLYGKNGEEEGKLGTEVHDQALFAENIEMIKNVFAQKTCVYQCLKTPSGCYSRKIAYQSCEDELVEFNVDITEMMDAMEVAQHSNELFHNVFINLPIGAALYDRKGYITDMNTSFMNLFGIQSIDDMKGYCFFADQNMTDESKQHVESDDREVYMADYDFDKSIGYKSTRQGKAKINSKIVHLYYGSQDIGYMVICIEDTDRLLALDRVKDMENYFSLISEYAKIGYSKINLVTNEGSAVRQWYKNLGEDEHKPIGEIVGVFEKLHPDDQKMMQEFVTKVKENKADHLSSVMRVKVSPIEDKWKWIFHSALLTDYSPEKGMIQLVSINYDITEFKEIEQELRIARDKAQEMDRLKSAFLANMSHEIRTPLNAIVGFSDLLVTSTDVKERKEFFSILRKNNDLLLQLINDILDLSKIEAGTMDFNYADVDVNRLCSDIAISMRLKVKENVEIIFTPTERKCHIKTDVIRLNQVISNFMNNAIKFTDHGHITLAYEWIDKRHIRFSVTDTGIGIDEESRLNIFDRFVKLNTFVPGTGLGLSICRSIVEQMGGDIGVDSDLGKGSCFWFVLPKSRS